MSIANEISQANTAIAHCTSVTAPTTDSAPITTSAGKDGPLDRSARGFTSEGTGRTYHWSDTMARLR